MDNIKPYYIYLRKSRSDREAEQHGEGETLARHEKVLSDLAHRNQMQVSKVFREVVSGETIAARPQMQALLTDVEQGLCAGVLVMEIERLARGDTKDQGIVAEAFKYGNVKIITPMKVYDPSNEFDEEYFEFGLFMSRREYKTINRRIQRGRIASVKEGKFISSIPPYGYEKVPVENDKGYTLRINPKEAEIVRMIFNWYTQGFLQPDGTCLPLSTASICHKLDLLHKKPQRADHWSPSSIRDILKNPVYTGSIRWAYRKEMRLLKNGIVETHRITSDNYIQCKGLHQGIISRELFDTAQKRMKSYRKSSTKCSNLLKNPLAGILVCAKCNTPMTRLAPNKKTNYALIKCPNRDCDNISAPLDLLEKQLITALEHWFKNCTLNPDVLQTTISTHTDLHYLKNSIDELKKELAALDKQLDNAFAFFERGIYTEVEFQKRKSCISSQIDAINSDLSTLQSEYEQLLCMTQTSTSDLLTQTDFYILDIYRHMDSAAGKNQLLKSILEKVEYLKSEKNKRGEKCRGNFQLTIYPKIPKI